jgi:hypothetical protein
VRGILTLTLRTLPLTRLGLSALATLSRKGRG